MNLHDLLDHTIIQKNNSSITLIEKYDDNISKNFFNTKEYNQYIKNIRKNIRSIKEKKEREKRQQEKELKKELNQERKLRKNSQQILERKINKEKARKITLSRQIKYNNRLTRHYPFQFHTPFPKKLQDKLFLEDFDRYPDIVDIIKAEFVKAPIFRLTLRHNERFRIIYDTLLKQFTDEEINKLLEEERIYYNKNTIKRTDRHCNVNFYSCSDIHYDINEYSGDFSFFKQLPLLTPIVIAGDVAGSIQKTSEFFKKYISFGRKVYFVLGNHCVYNNECKPIQDIIQEFKDRFPNYKINGHNKIIFLNNDWSWMDTVNNYSDRRSIAIIGVIGWTDYTYGNSSNVELNKIIANSSINDFKYGLYREDDGTIVKLTPDHCIKMHDESMEAIDRCYKEILSINPEATILLLTHHPLSAQCISKEYINSPLNAAFVTDKSIDWFRKYPNIKYIISGHVHNSSDFIMDEDTIYEKRYIVNPFGYNTENIDNFDKQKIINVNKPIIPKGKLVSINKTRHNKN